MSSVIAILEAHERRVSNWRTVICCSSPLSLEVLQHFLDQYHTDVSSSITGPAERAGLIATRAALFCLVRGTSINALYQTLDRIYGPAWNQRHDFVHIDLFFRQLGLDRAAKDHEGQVVTDGWYAFSMLEQVALTTKFNAEVHKAREESYLLVQATESLVKFQPSAQVHVYTAVDTEVTSDAHDRHSRTPSDSTEYPTLVADPEEPLLSLLSGCYHPADFLLDMEQDILATEVRITLEDMTSAVVVEGKGPSHEHLLKLGLKNVNGGRPRVYHWDAFFHVYYGIDSRVIKANGQEHLTNVSRVIRFPDVGEYLNSSGDNAQ